MFKKNHRHFQLPLTSNVDELPEKLRKRLDTSWSGVFYREFFSRLNETPFYYFRERLSRHMQESWKNLLDQAFEQVKDE